MSLSKPDHSHILISPMKFTDIPALQKLWKEVGFEFCYSDQHQEVEKMITQNPSLCLTLTSKEQIIGGVLGGFDGRRGWIHHLAIHPDYQKQGFGKLLMEEITDQFKALGVVKLKLEILKSNQTVIDFYQALGWDIRSDLTTMSHTLKSL